MLKITAQGMANGDVFHAYACRLYRDSHHATYYVDDPAEIGLNKFKSLRAAVKFFNSVKRKARAMISQACLDDRYTFTREFCGYPTARLVTRFCGTWIGAFEQIQDAVEAAKAHKVRRTER